jgi:hypothetical protein
MIVIILATVHLIVLFLLWFVLMLWCILMNLSVTVAKVVVAAMTVAWWT